MDKEQAVHSFWSSFDWKAWYEGSAPDNSADVYGKYITYDLPVSGFNEPVLMSGSLWQYSTSWAEITQKSNEISDYIGLRGKTIPYDGGVLWIKRGSPFAQRITDENDSIRRIYLNIEAEYITHK